MTVTAEVSDSCNYCRAHLKGAPHPHINYVLQRTLDKGSGWKPQKGDADVALRGFVWSSKGGVAFIACVPLSRNNINEERNELVRGQEMLAAILDYS